MLVIYGPPGVGKSALTRYFRLVGVNAHDLELFERHEREWAAANWPRGVMPAILSGADLMPGDFPKRADIKHVLLLPPKETYYPRRKQRDALTPYKAAQPDLYQGFVAAQRFFDAVSTHVGSIGETADDINRIHRMFFKRDIDGY